MLIQGVGIATWRQLMKLCWSGRNSGLTAAGVVAFLAVSAAGGPVLADEAWDMCTSPDPDVGIAGCTEVLARGTKERSE